MENKLKLNKDIYLIDNIRYCIEQYSHVCDIAASDDNKYYICVFSNCKYDLSETINEFENYLICYSNMQVHHNDNI